jgi:site-specific recombinase XerD
MPELAVINQVGPVVPALIAGAGERAVWRFLEFFTVNICNANTRAAYGRAAAAFLRWCEARGVRRLQDVQPVHVAAYIEQLRDARSAMPHASDGRRL